MKKTTKHNAYIPTLEDLEKWDDIRTKSSYLNLEERKWLLHFHQKVTTRNLFGSYCRNKFLDAITEITLALNKLQKVDPEFCKLQTDFQRKRKLRRGMVIHFDGTAYTRKTMTDEIIDKFLEKFPTRESYFD